MQADGVDFDLNVNPDLVVPMQLDAQNDEVIVEHVIIASSDSSDGENEIVMRDLNEPIHVEVFIPVD